MNVKRIIALIGLALVMLFSGIALTESNTQQAWAASYDCYLSWWGGHGNYDHDGDGVPDLDDPYFTVEVNGMSLTGMCNDPMGGTPADGWYTCNVWVSYEDSDHIYYEGVVYTTGAVHPGAAWAGSYTQNIAFSYSEEKPHKGGISINKSSVNASISGSHKTYSLAGAEYGIYYSAADALDGNTSATAEQLRANVYSGFVLTTDENGYAATATDALETNEGNWYVREIKPATGYARDNTVYTVGLTPNQLTPVNSPEGPIYGLVKAHKVDDLTKTDPQGNASLAGAEFTFKYYDGYYTESNLPSTPTHTWVIKTNANGIADISDTSLKVSGDAFCYAADGRTPVFPLGTVTYIETKAPEGYELGEPKLFVTQLTAPTDPSSTEAVVTPKNYSGEQLTDKVDGVEDDTVKRGDIVVVKYDDNLDRSEPQGDGDLVDVQFDIINRSTKPVISPEDGTTLVEPGKVICRITTYYDEAENVYKASTAAKDTNQKHSGSGTWNTPDKWAGALAYGEYEIVEVETSLGYRFGVWNGNTNKVFHGMAVKSGRNTSSWLGNNGQAFTPSSSSTWIDDNKTVVQFVGADHGASNTVKRGNIELIKADDNWNDSALQGDADLAGAVFEIYNASKHVVVTPSDGNTEIEPGKLVCTITTFKDTDGKYRATTNAPAGSAAATANGWSIPSAWSDGALPYGQYVVVEKTPPKGYMLNSEWVGRAINVENLHTDINFSVTNGNTFTLEGKTSNASATPTWINDSGVLVKFDNKKENESKASQEHYHNGDAVPQAGASLDTVDRVDETWCEDTIFRAGMRIGKVDRQNGEYKPQGGATLETAIITVSSLCDNPIWTLKGTYANGEKPTWGKVEAWNGNTSKKDGVDFLNIMVHKVTKTDGTVQYYASTRDDKGVAGVDFDDGALDITLPYGRYMLREISVDSADAIYDNLTAVNNGYLYDTISQNWRRQFSIGHATNVKHPALTYYNETGSFSTLVQGDAIANPTAIRVTPTDTIAYDSADNHPAGSQAANSKHGTILDMTATNDAIPNLVARFDIHFIKKDPDGKLLAGAVFAITSKTTGETHIAVTDENGKFDSFPSANQLTWHTKKSALGTVNGNDEGILSKKSDAGITYLDMSGESDEFSIDYASGVTYTTDEAGKSIVDSSNSKVGNGLWFYGRTDKKTYDPATATGNGAGGVTGNVNEDTRQYISSVRPDDIQIVRNDMGAFPYDDYIIQELPTANTIDYKMVRFEVHMVQATKDAPSDGFKNRTEMELKSPDPILSTSYPEYYERERVDAGTTVDNDLPEIHTTLVNEADVPIAAATENYTLIDKVEWYNLQNGHKYRIEGELWMKDANDVPIGTAPIATGKTSFTAQGRNGMTEMKFENLDLTKLGGASLVAYEFLYDEEGGTDSPIAEHKDPTDEGQTVTIPEIGTTLQDSDGDKEVSAYKEVKLIDHVSYKGLKPNQTYTFTGTLHLQNIDADGNITDGGVATDASGNPITATKDELIKSRDGEVDIEFTFMAPDLGGKKVVAFEEVSVTGQPYAVHTDITDNEQTVYFPDIKTTALDGVTGDHIGLADEEVTLEDVVEYKNLVKGKTYTIDGTLMDQETGESIKTAGGGDITGSITFVAGEDEGAVATPFNDEITLVSGTVKVPFQMNSDDIRGKAIVVFERLYNETEPTPEGEHEVEISKTDAATSEELPGATLVVTDSTGTTVAQWVSGDTPKKIKLDEGTYTLTEYTAPKGYTVTESIEFKVDENGLVDGDKVEMKNSSKDIPEGDKEIEISKTDAATSEELPGATLIVQDSTGTTVEQWVSGDTPQKVKLTEGTYKLIEITAPNGYAVAEAIEFTVDANGLVDGDKVEMKDAPTSEEPVAIHEDINDTNQQVNYPDIRTMAHVGGEKVGVTAAGEVHLTDVVSYTNLIPGREYTMEGILMDKVTGQPALTPEGQQITSQAKFVPETASGTMEMEFVFNARALQFHDVVVFENAYTAKSGVEGELIHVGKHENINDLDQTVGFGEDDIADIPIQSTGDDMPIMPLLITIGISFGAAAAFGLRRRFIK